MPSVDELLAELAANAETTRTDSLGRPQVAPGSSVGIAPRTPSWREDLAAFLIGDRPRGSRAAAVESLLGSRGAGTGSGLIDFTPAGIPLAVQEGQRAAEAGDSIGAMLGASAVVPGAGPAARAGRGRRAAITANSLRSLPLDEAIAQARTGQHIIPKAEGGFVGAPHRFQSLQDIDAARAAFDADVAAGAPGGDWYQRAQGGIKELAGPDPARQSLLAREQALTSAQADPNTNLGFALAGHNAYEMGTPAERIRTGQQATTYNTAREAGVPIPLGKKTGIYAGHMDPTVSDPTTGTNDIWHARALGYVDPKTGKPWEKALTAQQHAWMDAETVLAVDRANQQALGGRTDWKPGEIQAAPWVAGKGRALARTRRNMTPEQGLAEASKTYPDYFPKYTAYGTYEATPGVMTGHLPELVRADAAAREAFARDPRSGWRDAGDRDVLYDALGFYQRPGREMTGFYTPPGGVEETNLGWAARPMVGFQGPSGNRQIDDASRRGLNAVEATRAYFDAQGAGAWSKGIPGQKAGVSNAMMVTLPSELRTEENLRRLREIGERYQLGGLIDQGDQQMLTTFEEGATAPKSPKAQRLMREELEGVGARDIERAKRDSGYLGYEEAWEKGSEGSGDVTRQLFEYLDNEPTAMAKLESPEVRAAVLAKFDRDAEYAARTGATVRPDVQRARQIFEQGGFGALREAIGKGLVPAVAIGMFAPFLGGEGESPRPSPRALRTEREF